MGWTRVLPVITGCLVGLAGTVGTARADVPARARELFRRDNLVAW